jgi:hypothetical protein
LTINIIVSFWTLNSIPLVYVSILVLVSRWLDCCFFAVSF